MEYISKQSLLADLNEATPRSYFAFETMVREYPTEDVAPVVHAHWRERPISRFYDLVNYQMTRLKPCECSRCGCPCGNELMRYCPTCGARMDEEVNDA